MIAIMRTGSRKGFSLIEMLVVVGVILVLAGAIYPSLLKSKEWGRATKCLSNLRQLQIATLNHATDGGRFPLANDGWNQNIDGTWSLAHGWVGWSTWPGYPDAGPRAGNPGVGSYAWRGTQGLQCISNGALWSSIQKEKSVYLCPTFAQRTVCGQTDAVRSYSMNASLSYRPFADQSMQATRTVLYGDDGIVTNSPYDAQFTTNEVGRWHGAKGHVVYVDGHVDRW